MKVFKKEVKNSNIIYSNFLNYSGTYSMMLLYMSYKYEIL
jgi:hypothetical protein